MKTKASQPATEVQPELSITDQRMIQLMEYCVAREVGGYKNNSKWLDAVGSQASTLYHIRAGRQSFTREHLLAAARLFGANLNWLAGLEDNMLRGQQEDMTPLERMRTVLAELETEEQARKSRAGAEPVKAVRKRTLATVPASNSRKKAG